jgi:hypothetical protein
MSHSSETITNSLNEIEEYLKLGSETAQIKENSIVRDDESLIVLGPGIEIKYNRKQNKWDVFETTWVHEFNEKSEVVTEQIDQYDIDNNYMLAKNILLHILSRQLDVDFNSSDDE